MKELEYKPDNEQLSLTDRVAIEVGLARKESFAKIARTLRKHPQTISREIRNNRTHLPDEYPCGNDCRFYASCPKTHLCENYDEFCNAKCKTCRSFSCHSMCDRYESAECHKHEKAPYVCNACERRTVCKKNRYYYNARYADAGAQRRRSDSRKGVQCTHEELAEIGKLVRPLIKNGQPLTHIYAEHKAEFPISLRTLYNYIDQGKIWGVKNIDLRRKVGYKARRKRRGNVDIVAVQCRTGRTYNDFENAMKCRPDDNDVVEMDTVIGRKEKGKRLLTMIFRRNSVMLLFLMPDGKAESVVRVFDYLEAGLGYERFRRLFPVFLTDNGAEFKCIDGMEINANGQYRTRVYYCDPMASWQKAHIEKNHEYIRYVSPKGKSMNGYTQDDVTLLMNHINSTKRHGLQCRCPYELVDASDEDMKALFELLKMHLIPADEVQLTPELLVK